MKAVAYAITRNLYEDVIPSIKSLLMSTKVDKIYLLIEDDKFPLYLPDCVETINVRNQKFFKPDGPNMNSKFTYMAMMRATLAFILPESLDKVLALDHDTLIVKDISELWDVDLEDNYFSASLETHRTHHGLLYCNIGVTMYNLDLLRSSGKAKEVINVLNRRKYTWLEQDVFNYLCQGYILDMSGNYNANEFTIHGPDPKIIHFAGIKDWMKFSRVEFFRNYPWEKIGK